MCTIPMLRTEYMVMKNMRPMASKIPVTSPNSDINTAKGMKPKGRLMLKPSVAQRCTANGYIIKCSKTKAKIVGICKEQYMNKRISQCQARSRP